MRIAQIYHGFQRMAGTERFILETTHEMSRRQIEVRIYTTFVDRRLFIDRHAEVETKTVGIFRMPHFFLYSNLAASKRLIEAASDWADLMILHSGLSMAQYSWRKYNLPCVPFFHANQYDPSLFGAMRPIAGVYTFPLKALDSKCVRSIPLAFVNSHGLYDQIRTYTENGKLIIVPLGVDVDRFRPKWCDRGFVLMAGRLHPTNNFELGLAAAIDFPFKIVIAGIPERNSQWYYQHLQRIVKASSKLTDRVEFLRPDEEELIALIQNCSVFLSPRRYNYLGLAALEAMACGKPVIAYDTDDLSGSLPVMKCGDQPWKWHGALETLMADSQLRDRIGRESQQYIEEYHTWKKTVDTMLDATEKIT